MANAGHNYPVLINGEVSELELSGLPLGVDDESEYAESSAVIHPGGSKGDEDVLAAAEARAMAVVLTGTRHFRH